MATITQVQCDIENCTNNASFTGVQTTVKSATGDLKVEKMDLCVHHKQELVNLTPLVIGTAGFKFNHTDAQR